MGGYLRQSTAAVIPFGPFVDKTDGVTLEVGAGIITSIDHATTGIFLSKNGGAGAIRHQSVTASTLDAYGMFLVTLDTTDTNTIGRVRVMMAEAATFLPVYDDYIVLDETVYDVLFGTTAISTYAGADTSGTTSLLARLTATRAGYLDQLEHIHDDTNNAANGVSTLLTRLSALRAGYLDYLDAAITSRASATDLATIAGYIDTEIAAILEDTGTTIPASIAAIPSVAKKNTALANFGFLMTDSTAHEAIAGATVTCQRSIDGGAFGAGSLANITEIANGIYNVDFLAADLNGDVVVLRASATGADDTFVTIVTAK